MKNELKTNIIYQVFTRNYTLEGTFNALTSKLDYIKDLGTDILYLLPINEIGKVGRKGSLGSPYSIKDYYKINPEYGTLEDFKDLIAKTHEKGMKLMIDIVFNHTSRDSLIMNEHPEWMYHDKNGNFSNKVGDWSDVYDLDFNNQDLIDYLVKVIEYYCSLGVDGFRFDVASLIHKAFFIKLKEMLNEKYPDTILLAESIDASFTNYVRSLGFNALSDAELYEVGFDLLYTYNTMEELRKYLTTKEFRYLDMYKALLNYEESYNPVTNLRIRGLENHDQKRIIEYSKNKTLLKNLAAFPVFMKGPMFIYNGLETKADHHLDLFEKDQLDLSIDIEWFNFIKKLIEFKKDKLNLNLLLSEVLTSKGRNLGIVNHYKDGSTSYGLFNLSSSLSNNGVIIKDEKLIDGAYVDYFTDKIVLIKNHSVKIKEPMYLFKATDIENK